MSASARKITQNINILHVIIHAAVAGVTPMLLVLFAPPGTAQTGSSQHAVVARLRVNRTGQTADEIAVRVGDISVPATAIKASPDIPRSIAIVMDAGPDQKNVIAREKELAIALINEFSDGSTTFAVATAGSSLNSQANLEQSSAIERVRDVAATGGVKTNIPIYDPIGSMMRRIALSPGLRIVIFIGEGNDGGSKMRYSALRTLAESNQIVFLADLVADHSLRGTKSILRYGWNLRELADDTAGIFLENDKTSKGIRRLSENIRSLRLISVELPSLQPGRYKISVSERRGRKLRAQKAIVIPRV